MFILLTALAIAGILAPVIWLWITLRRRAKRTRDGAKLMAALIRHDRKRRSRRAEEERPTRSSSAGFDNQRTKGRKR